jgi:hypothetical protein
MRTNGSLPALLLLAATSCSTLERKPVPVERMAEAEIAGMSGVRAWAGSVDPRFQRDIEESIRQEPPGLFPRTADGGLTYKALAISGGGENGAFGAGFLKAWTETGSRPTFKIVTGISTGALTAPFAFVGPKYDRTLEEMYTGISAKDVYEERAKLAALGHESFADTAPLAALIARCVDGDLLKEVAEAHARGRRLYIGTTNLDADRLVVWNMGAIARKGGPRALDLFRQVMLASSSVPVVFPPVYIEVVADGMRYDEMHVDGGSKTQVFFHGGVLDLARAAASAGVTTTFSPEAVLYILRNGKLSPEPEQMPRKLGKIAGRVLATMVKSAGIGDLYRMYAFTRRDGLGFAYVGIPEDYVWVSDEEFDPEEMRRLFEVGHLLGSRPDPWARTPVGFETP